MGFDFHRPPKPIPSPWDEVPRPHPWPAPPPLKENKFMFGQNKLTKPYYDPKGTLHVHSMFNTIQGEGPFTGTPALFIRLAGCNLKCFFCDTDFETNTTEWDLMDLMNYVKEHMPMAVPGRFPLVVITGGEPMIQADLVHLCEALAQQNIEVQIETAGTVWQPGFDDLEESTMELVSFVVSPKTSFLNRQLVEHITAYKYVIRAGETSEDDGLPIKSTQQENKANEIYRPFNRYTPIYVMPMDENDPTYNQANIEEAARVAQDYGYKLCLQIHKIANLE